MFQPRTRRPKRFAPEPTREVSRTPSNRYDIFISYSRDDEEAARCLADALEVEQLKVFIDKSEIQVGATWQQRILDALEECLATVAVYSPSFITSKVCKDEFNVAFARRRDFDREFLFPMLVREAKLPTYMSMLNYADCTVSDKAKIKAAASEIAARLRSTADFG